MDRLGAGTAKVMTDAKKAASMLGNGCECAGDGIDRNSVKAYKKNSNFLFCTTESVGF